MTRALLESVENRAADSRYVFSPNPPAAILDNSTPQCLVSIRTVEAREVFHAGVSQ